MFYIQSCGTIIQGSTQQIGINSNPSKASVSINGQSRGTTPMIADLKRKDTHLVRIELEGYEAYEIALTRKVSGWVWGNIVFGGIIGLVVDASTGGMYKLTPDQINAEFKSGELSVKENNDEIVIAVTLKSNPNWEKVGTLSVGQK